MVKRSSLLIKPGPGPGCLVPSPGYAGPTWWLMGVRPRIATAKLLNQLAESFSKLYDHQCTVRYLQFIIRRHVRTPVAVSTQPNTCLHTAQRHPWARHYSEYNANARRAAVFHKYSSKLRTAASVSQRGTKTFAYRAPRFRNWLVSRGWAAPAGAK